MSRRRTRILPILSVLAILASVGLWAAWRFADERLAALALGGMGESFPTMVWSAPMRVSTGGGPIPSRVLGRLRALRYRQTEGEPGPGEFAWLEPAPRWTPAPPGKPTFHDPALPAEIRVGLREAVAPGYRQTAGGFRLRWGRSGWAIVSEEGREVPAVLLEPLLAAEISGPKRLRREPAAWEEFPPALIAAVLAAEDRRFRTHPGVDPIALARAVWRNATGSGVMQGGSTITQQLAKNFFLTPERTFKRKASEVLLALFLERRYSKEEILSLYLNHIYLGQDGPSAVMGMKAAARHYFGKDLRTLATGEAALLAGLIRSPARFNPYADPQEALGRRNRILGRMRAAGDIDESGFRAALAEPLAERPASSGPRDASAWFVAEVTRQLESRYEPDILRRQGLVVFTTLDPDLQRAAAETAASCHPQCAIVALDPRTGDVRALAGGRDFGESQFDRAVKARRQPGSAFKPFVFAAAIERGITPADALTDAPTRYALSGRSWEPANYGGVYHGSVTVRAALAHSLNAATLDLAAKVGMGRVASMARRLGLPEAGENPAAALGATETTLLGVTAAYAPFANGGNRVLPRFIVGVAGSDGSVMEVSPSETRRVLDPAVAALTRSLLESAVVSGTARGLQPLGFTRAAAGKTGTTNEGRDAWFIGFTPDLLAGVWTGDDLGKVRGLSGPKDAVPLWARFMGRSLDGTPVAAFVDPPGMVRVAIDPETGGKAVAGCPARVEETFLQGTEPEADCAKHKGGVAGWFQKLFSR